jgi:hypothetical protein
MELVKKNGMLSGGAEASTRAPGPRILMPTCRNFMRSTYRCSIYEAEDVLVDIDNVDLVCLEQGWGRGYENLLRRPMYHGQLLFMNPGLKRVQLTQEYDLFVAFFQSFWELPHINAIERWRDHCKTSICWIDEIWVGQLPGYKHWIRALSQFDYVFIGCRNTVATLSKAIGRTCHWVPGAVDALRFSPYPNPPARVIDIYSIGRRYEGIHQALLQEAGAGEIFYVYDTFAAAMADVYDYRQHRDLFANVAKRSRYFTVAPAKIDDRITRGQVEVGYRYYEGAAAGAAMIGQPPKCEAFNELFQWPDAVIAINPDGSDIIRVLNELGSDPTRVDAIGRRNAVEALLRHDWLYRWKEIFRVAGIEPMPGLAARERRLKELADFASNVTENEASVFP